MDVVGATRRYARRIVSPASWLRTLAVAGVAPLAASTGFLVAFLAFFFASQPYRTCLQVSQDQDALTRCLSENLNVMRAPLVAAVPLLIAVAVVFAVALLATPVLVLATIRRKERLRTLHTRFDRLEDAYARGVVSETLYGEARGHLRQAINMGFEGDITRDETRLLAAALFGATPILLASTWLLYWAGHLTWNSSNEPVVPDAWIVAVGVILAAATPVGVAYVRARREAPPRIAAAEAAMEDLWHRFLEEARVASLAAAP